MITKEDADLLKSRIESVKQPLWHFDLWEERYKVVIKDIYLLIDGLTEVEEDGCKSDTR